MEIGGGAASARLAAPRGVAVDQAGNIFIADSGNDVIRVVTVDGIINTVAGNGTRGISGDNGPATSAQLSYPVAVAVDANGNTKNHRNIWAQTFRPTCSRGL